MQMAKRRSDFGKDSGLQARMLMTMFLLGLVYVVFVGVLFAVGAAAGFIIVIALVMLLMQFFTSDKIALATLGAKEVTPEEQPELHGIIERLCVQADLPKGWDTMFHDFIKYLPPRLIEYDRTILRNQIFRARTIGIGAFTVDEAIE